LPQVPPESFPAAALAAFIYYVSGIRVTKEPPLAASQTARGVELLRLAVPARRYLPGTWMVSRKPFNTPMRDARKKSMD
jgi:tryptophanase